MKNPKHPGRHLIYDQHVTASVRVAMTPEQKTKLEEFARQHRVGNATFLRQCFLMYCEAHKEHNGKTTAKKT